MNKYEQQSREAQARRRAERMCTSKRRYDSEAAAYQKGQRSYHCPHCKGWHRSGALASLVAKVRKPKR